MLQSTQNAVRCLVEAAKDLRLKDMALEDLGVEIRLVSEVVDRLIEAAVDLLNSAPAGNVKDCLNDALVTEIMRYLWGELEIDKLLTELDKALEEFGIQPEALQKSR
jgi:hypothetical protein